MNTLLDIKDLYVNAGEKQILKGLNLQVNKGEIHVIMGPNGAGKSTLANVILNNPEYTKKSGVVEFDGENINELTTDKIAKKGVFMSFQSPEEIPGISNMNFLKYAKGKITEKPVRIFEFKKQVMQYAEELNMNPKLIERNLNVGFSGGEKKKNEILQMLVLEPKLAILDETDSGLDVDAIRTVSKGIEMYKSDENAVVIITHNTRILQYLDVDYVHVLVDGKIVKTGDGSLAKTIEENGYEEYKRKEDKSIMRERLTKSEMAIMEILWEEGKGLTATEIVNIAGEKKTWKDSSIHLLINKLLDKGVIEVVGFRKTMKNYARTFFPVDSKQKYIVNQITDGMSEEERKKLYEYLIGEEKKLEMIKYIQNLLTKRKEKCTEIHNI